MSSSLLLLSWMIVCKSSHHDSLKYFLAFSIFLMTFFQAIIKEDWKKLEQLNKKQHD
jgi:hypothetical protein